MQELNFSNHSFLLASKLNLKGDEAKSVISRTLYINISPKY